MIKLTLKNDPKLTKNLKCYPKIDVRANHFENYDCSNSFFYWTPRSLIYLSRQHQIKIRHGACAWDTRDNAAQGRRRVTRARVGGGTILIEIRGNNCANWLTKIIDFEAASKIKTFRQPPPGGNVCMSAAKKLIL